MSRGTSIGRLVRSRLMLGFAGAALLALIAWAVYTPGNSDRAVYTTASDVAAAFLRRQVAGRQ